MSSLNRLVNICNIKVNYFVHFMFAKILKFEMQHIQLRWSMVDPIKKGSKFDINITNSIKILFKNSKSNLKN
jgi:hypothetical protein